MKLVLMNASFLFIGFVLLCITLADSTEITRCCAGGSRHFRETQTCTGVRSVGTSSICTRSASICCLRALLDGSCNAGTENARQNNGCTVDVAELGGVIKKECCDCCALAQELVNREEPCVAANGFSSSCLSSFNKCCNQSSVGQQTSVRNDWIDTNSQQSTSDPCKNTNCEHFCSKTSDGSAECYCRTGYGLGSDGHSCVDVDECLLLIDDCLESQRCLNLPGSFKCIRTLTCGTGYAMDSETEQCTVLLHRCCLAPMFLSSSQPIKGSTSISNSQEPNALSSTFIKSSSIMPTSGLSSNTIISTSPVSIRGTARTKSSSLGFNYVSTEPCSYQSRKYKSKEASTKPSSESYSSLASPIRVYIRIQRDQTKPEGHLQLILRQVEFSAGGGQMCSVNTPSCLPYGFVLRLKSRLCPTPVKRDDEVKSSQLSSTGLLQLNQSPVLKVPAQLPASMQNLQSTEFNSLLTSVIHPVSIKSPSHRVPVQKHPGSYRCDSRRCAPSEILNPTTGECTSVDCPQGYVPAANGKCEDIDECQNAQRCSFFEECINIPGSYRCQEKGNLCSYGYQIDKDTGFCADKNECDDGSHSCGSFQCINLPGSFKCRCPAGFEFTEANKKCEDVNECEKFSGATCSPHATCENTIGSFKCHCKDGFQLAADGRNCDDVDECTAGLARCQQKCVNVPGSYQCLCQRGYQLGIDELTCEDINECSTWANPEISFEDGITCKDVDECVSPGICQGDQLCVNTLGGFKCQALDCPKILFLIDITRIDV
uniref:EGF-like domain-containing protein n=1 Tax=Ditylenchus dipsaci TaxID=166011 RepID=A0A915EU13_9BILA